MRKFTDIFIERPVLATVVSLTIFVLGLRSIGLLPVLQYPRTQNAVVTVTTVYVGADPALVAGFITAPLENSIAQANGIDYMSSVSRQSVSTITIALRLNYEVDKALTEINTKVNAVLNQFPPGTQQPVLTVKVGQAACGTTTVSRPRRSQPTTAPLSPAPRGPEKIGGTLSPDRIVSPTTALRTRG